MHINLTINGEKKTIPVQPHDRLLRVLRREGYFSVKFGDEQGYTGSDAILLDGALVNAQTMLAAQADRHTILTLEGIGTSTNLHPLQKAFIETGGIQSGYNTPAQILAAYALLQRFWRPMPCSSATPIPPRPTSAKPSPESSTVRPAMSKS